MRPLHYATHIDALIFGYYAEILLEEYEKQLNQTEGLADCITAYRKIRINGNSENQGKSTIHFAHEAFSEIKKRAIDNCVVLMFDIKSFFNEIDHAKLKSAWCRLISVNRLNQAHFNVFKAATNFRYILKDDLRLWQTLGRRVGFDEKKLAAIRKRYGTESFFHSEQDFRDFLKSGKVRVFKNPFMKEGMPVGIPQGLPISAVLANLYLLDFDKKIFSTIVRNGNGFYRRYSDDILIICKPDQAEEFERFVLDAIRDSKVEISTQKTEKFLFKSQCVSRQNNVITSILMSEDKCTIGKPLTYLGFEFYGEKTLIKSANLARFYRRMLYSVKARARRACKIANSVSQNPAIFRARLIKIYSRMDSNVGKRIRYKRLFQKTEIGYFKIKLRPIKVPSGTNYFTYVDRAAKIMQEPSIRDQVRKHRHVFNAAINKYLKVYSKLM